MHSHIHVCFLSMYRILDEGDEPLKSEGDFPGVFFIAGCSSLVLFSIKIVTKVMLVIIAKDKDKSTFHGHDEKPSRRSRFSEDLLHVGCAFDQRCSERPGGKQFLSILINSSINSIYQQNNDCCIKRQKLPFGSMQ